MTDNDNMEANETQREVRPCVLLAQLASKMFSNGQGVIVLTSPLENGATTAFDFASNLEPSQGLVEVLRTVADRIEADVQRINEAIRGSAN